jgi:hypothetical protein
MSDDNALLLLLLLCAMSKGKKTAQPPPVPPGSALPTPPDKPTRDKIIDFLERELERMRNPPPRQPYPWEAPGAGGLWDTK